MTDSATDNRTTELLCKMLDERGRTWKKRRGYIRWSKRTVHGITHYQAWPCHDGTVTLTIHDEYALTPEQAIAATLGGGECEFRPFKDEDWSEPNAVRGVCSECAALMYGKDNYCSNCGKRCVHHG